MLIEFSPILAGCNEQEDTNNTRYESNLGTSKEAKIHTKATSSRGHMTYVRSWTTSTHCTISISKKSLELDVSTGCG